MNIEEPASDQAQSAQRDDTAKLAVPGRAPPWIGKSGELGCVFAGLAVRVGDRSPDDYAAFLEEL